MPLSRRSPPIRCVTSLIFFSSPVGDEPSAGLTGGVEPKSVDGMSGLCQCLGMRRTERLFAMTELLRSRRTGITAEEIAERFDITVRTVYRDLDALRAASLPLRSDRGPGGGYALDRSYSLPPVNFTAREAAVLVALGAFATEMRALPFTETLGTALDKVRAALPKTIARELEKKLEELTFVGVPQVPVPDEVRRAVERAWFEGTELVVVYTNANGEKSTRRVVVKKVVMDRRETRLFVYDLERDAERELLLHRIESARTARPASTTTPPAKPRPS